MFRRLATMVMALALVLVVGGAAYAWHEGYRLYIVHTGSMEPTLMPGDAVLDRPAPAAVQPGQIITFRYAGPDSVVTHRVASFADGVVHTKGDANATVDPWTLPMSSVVGEPARILPGAGYVLYYLKQPTGLASIFIAVVSLVLLWGLFFPPAAADPTAISGRADTGAARRRAAPRHSSSRQSAGVTT